MADPTLIHILIADDHPMMRTALHSLISSEPGMVVVGEARDGEAVVRMFQELRPDVTLMDLNMPKQHGLEAIRQILDMHPEARIIILTNSDTSDDIQLGYAAGAKGYLVKDTPQVQLLEVIRTVHRGGKYIPHALAARITSRETTKPLSERELQILRLVMTGKNNLAIGHQLGISESTVKTHLKNILLKLDVSDRTQAVRKALQLGILRIESPD